VDNANFKQAAHTKGCFIIFELLSPDKLPSFGILLTQIPTTGDCLIELS
jgi:hypothetical protein